MATSGFTSARYNEEKGMYEYPALVDAAFELYLDASEVAHDISVGCMCHGSIPDCCGNDLAKAGKEADKAYMFMLILDTICGNRVFPLIDNKEGA